MNNDTNQPCKKHRFETGLNREGNETQKLILKELQSLHKTIENGFLHMRNVSKKVNKMSRKVKFLESYQVQKQLRKNKKKLRKSDFKLLQKKSKKKSSQPKTSLDSFNSSQVNCNQDCISKIPNSMNSNDFVVKRIFTDKKYDCVSKSFITRDIESVDKTFFTSSEQDYSNKLTLNCRTGCTTKQNHNVPESDSIKNLNISNLTTIDLGKKVDKKKNYKLKMTKKKDKTKKKKSKKSKKDKSKESKKSKKDKLRAKHKSKNKKLHKSQYSSFDKKISTLVKSAFSLSSPKFVFEPSVESKALEIFHHPDGKYKSIENFSSDLYGDHPSSVTGSNTATTSSSNSENDIDIRSCDLNELENPSIVIETSGPS